MGKRAETGHAPSSEVTTASGPNESRACPTCSHVAGTIEAAARADLAAILQGHPFADTLSATVLTLARALDNDAGLSTAAVSRELRANLVELARLGVPDDDDLDAALSTPVRDAA